MKLTSVMALLLVTVQTNAATVVVVSTPKGAEVFVGKNLMGKTPCRLALPEGKYTLVLKHPKCENLTHFFAVGRKLLVLKLQLPPKKYPVDLLFKDLTQEGWDVFTITPIKYVGTVPGTMMLPKGKYKLIAMRSGFADVRFSVTVKGDEIPTPDKVLSVELPTPKQGRSSIRRVKHLKYVDKWAAPAGNAVMSFKSDFKCEYYYANQLRWARSWKFVWPDTLYFPSMDNPDRIVMAKENEKGQLVGSRPGQKDKQIVFSRVGPSQ